MNFYKDHASTFLKPKFIVFLMKKSQTLASKMSEHSCWGFLWNTWKISLRLHKYGFVHLNGLRIAANTFFHNPKTANYWKRCKKGFPSKHLCKYFVTYLYPNGHTPNQITKSYLARRRRNFDFIFIGSEVIVQKRLRILITLWPIASRSRHLTRRHKCDEFWLPGAESFPTDM